MPRPLKPFVVQKRKDTKTWTITINTTSGIPASSCRLWKRKSFQNLPVELVQYQNPKNKSAAEAGAFALIQYLSNSVAESKPVRSERITVGTWLEKFTKLNGNPHASRLIAKGRPYSIHTIKDYESKYKLYLEDDPCMAWRMDEIDETAMLEFISRMAERKMKDKVKMAGRRTFEIVLKFVRMAFKEYRKTHHEWTNPFIDIDSPTKLWNNREDILSEEEVVSLFRPAVLRDTMELAVCAAIF
jgi:hypothetical protein